MKVAQVLYQELDIGAVAITDREKLLAFTGIGDGPPFTRQTDFFDLYLKSD
ncbi:sensor histidine kinase [Escherichia coli]|uniref:Sensor histidine kinase n=1 Tax=Escherichia coli TaxID=562 RepID=A0A377DQ27_ECOLX|nr:sensor histidine kinase [Escherichia coli]